MGVEKYVGRQIIDRQVGSMQIDRQINTKRNNKLNWMVEKKKEAKLY